MDETYESTYLGDGVYASHDGFQVWLAVNHHENNVLVLEPEVFFRLCEYVKRLEERNS